MKQRLITAVFGFAVLAPVLLFSDTLVLPAAVAIFSAIAILEMLGCIGLKKRPEVLIPSALYAFAGPIVVRYLPKYTSLSSTLALIAAISFIYLFYLLCITVVSKGTKNVLDIALTFMTTIYISIGFSSIVMIRDQKHGQFLILLVFIGAWVTDGAAYFVGRVLGKHKLIPDVSPKKTVEGAVGGIIFCAISFVIYGIIVGKFSASNAKIIELVISGVIIAIISEFGDLIASLIKRHYGIKDYGKIFPGHGGVMDRFDSIIAIAPFLLMMCAFPNIYALFV